MIRIATYYTFRAFGFLLLLTLPHLDLIAEEKPIVRIGSKSFTESVILGDLLSHLARDAGAQVEHRSELGGTQVLWKALVQGDIDAYIDYTGTIREELLVIFFLKGKRKYSILNLKPLFYI